MITEPVQETDLAKAREATFQECVNYAGENQYNLRVKSEGNKEITLTSITLNDWEQQILSASNILSHCDGVELQEFCIGSECSIEGKAHRGLYMKLEYDKSKEVIVFQ
jgi:hypothetical protein